MQVKIFQDKAQLGHEMAKRGADLIKAAVAQDGQANIILATGASQFEILDSLVAMKDIDWSRVTVFHLDEYVGLSDTHGASFRKYLRERFVTRVSGLREFVEVIGDAPDLNVEIARLNARIKDLKIAVCFAGIGENAHLAFNDPPANFETRDPYLIVELDDACRKQQLGEGWFPTFDSVPKQAISMSVRQILASQHLLITVPDLRKAEAVKNSIEGPLTPLCPASVLRLHPSCLVALDKASSSLLSFIP
ncbi:MAG: glucosamine-6-phosphate deaminase [Methylocystaceae bacterium]|nr:glucosamine-6-phosphate deaminase [Methylocystaceae bacterium]